MLACQIETRMGDGDRELEDKKKGKKRRIGQREMGVGV